ncbi:MAG TPA: Omp28-related outer membrane protein [Bacteroidales bacterium]|nr:Omp28-related outer membrane protein [Bacteroidales bacterium]HSA43296.1 Omp28-related outer membrane protein [Bacteroidales bacterium]
MKTVLPFFFVLAFAVQASGQTLVDTLPANKNAILEEFTGVKCPNCPGGHQTAQSILTNNPGRAFVVAFHPFNSSFTTPYTGEPDFRRHYGDSLYMTPYCGTSRYMPSAFVNRRLWAAPERLTGASSWTGYCNTIMAETSPVNVGLSAHYDGTGKMLSVTVEVWYTAAVSGSHNLMVTLAENNLVSTQSGGTSSYTHKHTFREALTGQWGDPLSNNASAGTFITETFSFDNTTASYNMGNCEVMAYIIDNGSDEVITGNGVAVGSATAVHSEARIQEARLDVYPNPASVSLPCLRLVLPSTADVSCQVVDVNGKVVSESPAARLHSGIHELTLSQADLLPGLYFIRLRYGAKVIGARFIMQ